MVRIESLLRLKQRGWRERYSSLWVLYSINLHDVRLHKNRFAINRKKLFTISMSIPSYWRASVLQGQSCVVPRGFSGTCLFIRAVLFSESQEGAGRLLSQNVLADL